jgi:hypothetical protein
MALLREDDVRQLLRPLIRSRTVLEPVDRAPRPGELVATRFGGLPTGCDDERWPTCSGCAHDLTFVVQVDLARDALHDSHPIAFFTFFYCWNCHPWGRSGDEGQWLVRTYPVVERPRVLTGGEPTMYYPAGLVERFTTPRMEQSLPDAVGLELHCPELWRLVPGTSGSPEAWTNWAVVERAALDLTRERAPAPHQRNGGVAIGGYPYWANGPDRTPRCADCTEPMDLLLQIRPTELTDAMWGDVGTVYLFACRTHTRRTGLRVQST